MKLSESAACTKERMKATNVDIAATAGPSPDRPLHSTFHLVPAKGPCLVGAGFLLADDGADADRSLPAPGLGWNIKQSKDGAPYKKTFNGERQPKHTHTRINLTYPPYPILP